jgi:hypothetical protein
MIAGAISEIDRFLASALRCPTPAWPDEQVTTPGLQALCVRRALYHGIAALLVEREDQLAGWPPSVIGALRREAVAQAMWELRHRLVLTDLLAALRNAGVNPIILKGTGVAYDLYKNPAWRMRGDTDLLVSRLDLDRSRKVLRQSGYVSDLEEMGRADPARLQEPWTFVAPDGSRHSVDLHWETLNSWALMGLLSYDQVFAQSQALPGLCEDAITPVHVLGLLHACLHRAQHMVTPYIVDGEFYYGGDRLIWLYDIDLFAHVLSLDQWEEVCEVSVKKGIAGVCLQGLQAARAQLDTAYPAAVHDRLASAKDDTVASRYLGSRQVIRSWQDWRAVPGLSMKLEHLLWRLFPPSAFLRAKYPHMAHRWLPLLYARRYLGFARRRGGQQTDH